MDALKAEEKLFAGCFKLAKAQCANYSDMGPRKLRGYCWMAKDHQCLLLRNLPCEWFRGAVLSLDTDLLGEWQRIFDPEQVITASAWTKSARCECGKLFRSKSNRQTKCEECSAKFRKIKQREYRNKNRGPMAIREHLEPKFTNEIGM